MPELLFDIETRTLRTEVRASADKFELQGRAASYNTPTVIRGSAGQFREQVAPGAFAQSLKEKADVKCTFNHDPNHVLGRTKSGTLVLSDSSAGLNFRCILDKTISTHRDLYAAVKRGDISECSFAFKLQADGSGDDWAPGKDSIPQRTLKNVQLVDVSVVTQPAYGGDATNVSARSGPARKPTQSKVLITWETLASAQRTTVEKLKAASVAAADSALRAQAKRQSREIRESTDADLRRRAARAKATIVADAAQYEKDSALFERMQNAAGIVAGRRKL